MYEREILEVYEYCGIRSFPVDCDRILDKFGFRILTYTEAASGDPEKLKRLKQISPDGFIVRGESALYINEAAYGKRIRFTKAHEIGHLVMVSDDEDVADTFASNLLAPRPIIFAEGLKNADDIASYFGISVSAANIALSDMKHRGEDFFPKQSTLEVLDYFGYRHQFPSMILYYRSKPKEPLSPIIRKLRTEQKEKERLRKRIKGVEGKIRRLERKLVVTKDEAEYYGAKKELAEQKGYLDLLKGRKTEDDF